MVLELDQIILLEILKSFNFYINLNYILSK